MKILSQFESRGNIELLSQKIVAVFSSKNTPAEIYPVAEKLFERMIHSSLSLAGGWQAPLEKELLGLTHPSMKANIIYYTAKDLSQIKLSQNLMDLEREEKLLIVSAQSRRTRPSKSDIDKRDALLFKQVSHVLFNYIKPGGRLEGYFNRLQQAAFPVFMLRHPLNESFLVSGCPALDEDNLAEAL